MGYEMRALQHQQSLCCGVLCSMRESSDECTGLSEGPAKDKSEEQLYREGEAARR